ncbi:MAG: methyltransferase domain-containing protein [Methanosarcinales archaeon]|nr:methyltransferase domain-containing protein [Methanosarcinales archaeon]
MKLPGTATQPENIHIALGKLDIQPGMVFLDVGCGSGAVSLAACRFTDRIYGIDRRAEAVLASRALVPGATFRHGEAVEILDRLPPVDRCFIGGTRGIEDFLPELARKAHPGCRMVVNLARMGVASRVAELMEECCTLEEVLQVQICRGYPLAGDWALRPVNPIFMVVGRC